MNVLDEQDELGELRAALGELSARVAALETASSGVAPLPGQAPSKLSTSAQGQADADDPFWALETLRAKLGDHPVTEQGAVMLVGALTLPTGAPVAWQESAGTENLFETEWSELAAGFAALGHPVRLELLRLILSGMHATADLAAVETFGTTGQLHHHLRQLVAAGWVRQSGRGNYEVPAARVVPLLVGLVGVAR